MYKMNKFNKTSLLFFQAFFSENEVGEQLFSLFEIDDKRMFQVHETMLKLFGINDMQRVVHIQLSQPKISSN